MSTLVVAHRTCPRDARENSLDGIAAAARFGADVVEVRKPEQLEGLDGLVIPGGESTTITRLMRLYGIDEALCRFEGAVFGTCAGMILLDREHLGLVDLVVDLPANLARRRHMAPRHARRAARRPPGE